MIKSFGTYRNHQDRIRDRQAKNIVRAVDRNRSQDAEVADLLEELVEQMQVSNLLAISTNDHFHRDMQLAAIRQVTDFLFPEQKRD